MKTMTYRDRLKQSLSAGTDLADADMIQTASLEQAPEPKPLDLLVSLLLLIALALFLAHS